MVSEVTLVLVPQGLTPNIIEDLESNYHNINSLYQKAAQLKDLLPEEDFSSISKFLEDLKGYISDYKSQESRSGLLLQEIAIKFKYMGSTLNPAAPILREKLLKEQAEDLRKFVEELGTKIDGIKADPMMFTKEKADDLHKLIQFLKEKYSPIPDSIEEFYATQTDKEAKTRQLSELDHQKRTLETQIQRIKVDKHSKNSSLGKTLEEIRSLNQKLEEVKNVSNHVFHYIFMVDISKRDEGKDILEEVNSNIEALIAAKGSEGDFVSLVTFGKGAQVLVERLPIFKYDGSGLKKKQPQTQENYFGTGLQKVRNILKKSTNKEEIPVLFSYTDGMRWYCEAELVSEENLDFGEGLIAFLSKLSNIIASDDGMKIIQCSLKPIKKGEIQNTKKLLAEFSSDHNLSIFVSETRSQNQENFRNFARALSPNETVLQTTIGGKYEYFKLASTSQGCPPSGKILSITEKGSEEKEICAQDALKDLSRKRLLEEQDDLEKELTELLSRKAQVEYEIKTFLVETDQFSSKISSIENEMRDLNEDIRLLNEEILEQEQRKKDREKIEEESSVIHCHLDSLEQLTKTVQARDHNIMAIFEHVTTYCKDFWTSLERILGNDEASDFDLLIEFYRDRLGLYTTDVENMEMICQFWFGDRYDEGVTKNFFMMINPRDMVDNELGVSKVEQAIESLYETKSGRRDFDEFKEEYLEFYLNLRKKISSSKMEQKLQAMKSQKDEIKKLFSQDMKKLMEKLNERIYMMY